MDNIDMDKSVLLSTYINTVNGETYALFGPIDNITGYLSTKFKNVYIICQPAPGETEITPTLCHHGSGKLIRKLALPKFLRMCYLVDSKKLNSNQTVIRLKIRDFISNLYFIVFCIRNRIDLFIGVESINALGGILLRIFSYVKSVVYFSNDYHTERYPFVKNWLFLKLDEIASYRSDAIWMMNPDIPNSRIQRGLKSHRLAPHFIIHGGLPFFPRAPIPIPKRNKTKIVYATRSSYFGLDIVLRAFSRVVKTHSKICLYITGNIPLSDHSGMLNALGLAEHVIFTGFIREDALNQLVEDSYLGLAIYPNDGPSRSAYGDPEKIRRYIHFGLPVIATGTGYTVRQITTFGAGIVIDDTTEAVSGAIMTLLEDEVLYESCAKSAEQLGRHYKENNLIDIALSDMQTMKIF